VEVEEEGSGKAWESENLTGKGTKGVVDVTVQPSPKAFEAYSPGFLQVFEAFPVGYRDRKRECFTLWQTRALESRAPECVEKVVRLKLTVWPKKQPEHRPCLHTWLERARYDDELAPVPVPTSTRPVGPDPFDPAQQHVQYTQCTDMAELMRQCRAAIGDRGEAA
jgi:hypothetical protein